MDCSSEFLACSDSELYFAFVEGSENFASVVPGLMAATAYLVLV